MREIKFRIWDKKYKTFEYNASPDVFISTEGEVFEKDYRNFGMQSHLEYNKSDDYEISQYTGLKDKNGKEIYEGDILEVKQNYLFKIIWHEESWGYEVIKNEALPICGYIKGHVSRGGLKHYNNTSQVIGNIFANPELMEAAE